MGFAYFACGRTYGYELRLYGFYLCLRFTGVCLSPFTVLRLLMIYAYSYASSVQHRLPLCTTTTFLGLRSPVCVFTVSGCRLLSSSCAPTPECPNHLSVTHISSVHFCFFHSCVSFSSFTYRYRSTELHVIKLIGSGFFVFVLHLFLRFSSFPKMLPSFRRRSFMWYLCNMVSNPVA